MNKHAVEPQWQELRQQLVHAWNRMSDEDLDALERMHLQRSARARRARDTVRSDRRQKTHAE